MTQQNPERQVRAFKILSAHPQYNPGFIPSWLRFASAPAKEQLDNCYRHGGGWRAFGKDKWKLGEDNSLTYPGDPTHPPRCVMQYGEELVIMYDHAWVAIIQPDRSFEVARMD